MPRAGTAGSFNVEVFDDIGCLPCMCDVGGSVRPECDQLSGQCTCVSGTTGTHCDRYVCRPASRL